MPDYRAIASQMAARYGLPAGLFASLIAHESNWNPGAVSPAGAIGLGQLMPGTAQGLGVNPRDPVQNLQGAARYLSDQYRRFHDWRLALAAYNAGPGAVAKYGGVPPYSETQAYVRNVLGSAGDLTPVASGRGPGIPPPSVAAPAPAAPPQQYVDPRRLRALLAQDLYRASQTGDYAGFLERSRDTREQLSYLAGRKAAIDYTQPRRPQARGKKNQQTGAPLISGDIIGTPHSGTHTRGNWESDNALDISMPVGTPIYAPFDGAVGSQWGALSSNDPRLQGLRMHLIGKGNELYFAHLSKLAVKPGQWVKRGQLIGYSGSANGVAHLHLGSRKGNPRRYAAR